MYSSAAIAEFVLPLRHERHNVVLAWGELVQRGTPVRSHQDLRHDFGVQRGPPLPTASTAARKGRHVGHPVF